MQLKNEEASSEVGVIVGRFQAPYLHAVHFDLIKTVADLHIKVIVVLGVSKLKSTYNNPLSFDIRRKMIHDLFPDVTVVELKDVKDDSDWSKSLDEVITENIPPTLSAILYGGRDSFIHHYFGRFKTREFNQDRILSGTMLRIRAALNAENSKDFRAGICWATGNQYPKVWATVDIAILNENETKILLGRKPDETKFRFIGGFSDIDSDSYEADARREVYEETNLEITDPEYICSQKINDWRYRGERDVIKTLFFKARMQSGILKAGDDIREVRWFDFPRDVAGQKDLASSIIIGHRELLGQLYLKM